MDQSWAKTLPYAGKTSPVAERFWQHLRSVSWTGSSSTWSESNYHANFQLTLDAYYKKFRFTTFVRELFGVGDLNKPISHTRSVLSVSQFGTG